MDKAAIRQILVDAAALFQKAEGRYAKDLFRVGKMAWQYAFEMARLSSRAPKFALEDAYANVRKAFGLPPKGWRLNLLIRAAMAYEVLKPFSDKTPTNHRIMSDGWGKMLCLNYDGLVWSIPNLEQAGQAYKKSLDQRWNRARVLACIRQMLGRPVPTQAEYRAEYRAQFHKEVLASLLLDLGYTKDSPPVPARNPMRHCHLWVWCEQHFREDFGAQIDLILADRPRPQLAGLRAKTGAA